MGMSLAIYIRNEDSGIELARYNELSESELLAQWYATPQAKSITSHFLVLMSEQDHINAKFIDAPSLNQLLHLWGKFDSFYQDVSECG
ncbi:hypothetical protein [Vibrio methylphosphonaticus]|uniref:hypothetical protein n=1 Tax=Vibrio methylphosphonaticus TaxID=2946866 RepID=UPI00202A1635|nr:hypothetical protein [Vibrio methylphosphonaticus]MCL9774812.1 hypothetical protein [Vibrio methylphosphonaticus]